MLIINQPHDNFVDLLNEQAAKFGDKPAFHFLEESDSIKETISYADLAKRAQATAVVLRQQYPQGSRVLLLYPSCIDYMVAFFGCLYAGMIAVPMFPPKGNKQNLRLEGIIEDSGAEIALTTSRQLQQMEALITTSPHLSRLNILCSEQLDPSLAKDWQRPTTLSKDTIAFLQYTSGSTGIPKGVIVSHGNMLHNEVMLQATFQSDSSSVYVTWLPIYHDMGLIGNMLHAVWLGATCYFMAPASFLQRPIRWLEIISRFGATISGGPNFAFQLCANKISPQDSQHLDLSNWQVAFNGSEPVRHDTIVNFYNAFKHIGFRYEIIVPCYGMAESTLISTGGNLKDHTTTLYLDRQAFNQRQVILAPQETGLPLVANGGNLPQQRIAIVDPETGIMCKPSQIGEIWLSGPHIGHGYWQRPEMSRDTFQAHVSEHGDVNFLRTGDLGFMHEDELYVAGRINDLVIVHGMNYYPQDIEKVVEEASEQVNSYGSAVFSISDEQGVRVVAVVEIGRTHVRKFNPKLLAGTIRQQVFEQHELMLNDIVFIRPNSLPKTSSGKVQRRRTQQFYLTGELSLIENAALAKG